MKNHHSIPSCRPDRAGSLFLITKEKTLGLAKNAACRTTAVRPMSGNMGIECDASRQLRSQWNSTLLGGLSIAFWGMSSMLETIMKFHFCLKKQWNQSSRRTECADRRPLFLSLYIFSLVLLQWRRFSLYLCLLLVLNRTQYGIGLFCFIFFPYFSFCLSVLMAPILPRSEKEKRDGKKGQIRIDVNRGLRCTCDELCPFLGGVTETSSLAKKSLIRCRSLNGLRNYAVPSPKYIEIYQSDFSRNAYPLELLGKNYLTLFEKFHTFFFQEGHMWTLQSCCTRLQVCVVATMLCEHFVHHQIRWKIRSLKCTLRTSRSLIA